MFWGKEHHFVFIGDMRLRALYDAFVSHLELLLPTTTPREIEPPPKNNELAADYIDVKLKLKLNYIFADDVQTILEELSEMQISDEPPPVIIASATQSRLLQGNITKTMIDTYMKDISKLLPSIDMLVRRKKSKLLWKLQDPLDEEKISEEWKLVKNDVLEQYNYAAKTMLKHSGALIWSSSVHIADGLLDEAVEGWRLGRLAVQHNLQILLNMYCNDYMNFNDGSCCSSAEPYTILQVITYSLFGIR